MSNLTTWYVVADGGKARILTRRPKNAMFDTHADFTAANIHSRVPESAGVAHHTVASHEDPHQAGKRVFIDHLAEILNTANRAGEFDCLILAAPSHALSELNQALDAPTKLKIASQLQKDLTHVSNGDLADHFSAVIDNAHSDA